MLATPRLAGIATMLATFFAANPAAAATFVVVEPGTVVPIINSADIDNAGSEPVIINCNGPGSQTLPIVINNKETQINCPGWHVATDGEPPLLINGKNNGVTVFGLDLHANGSDGVRINSGRNVTLRGLTISGDNKGKNFGIRDLTNTPDSRLNVIDSNIVGFGNASGGGGIAIFPRGDVLTDTLIQNNTIIRNNVGVDQLGGNAMIKDSVISNNTIGVRNGPNATAILGGNHIFSNTTGFFGNGLSDGTNNFYNPDDINGTLFPLARK